MKTKTVSLIISLVFVSLALGVQDSPHMGTWKLNEAKSKFAGTARNQTVVYEATGDQIKITVDGTDNGAATHNEWTGKFDGKDYPVTGDASSDTRAYKVINKHTLEMTLKKDGKVRGTGRIVVSADGKTRTVTTHTTDAQDKKVTNVAVYDKQ